MTLEATLALLRAIMADLPAAIATGSELIALVNEAFVKLGSAGKGNPTAADIAALVGEIKANSARIQSE